MQLWKACSPYSYLRLLSLVLLVPVAAIGRTFEGFTLSAKAGWGIVYPYLHPVGEPGNGMFLLSPGVKLFENRLTLEADLGLTEKFLVRGGEEDEYWESWDVTRDTMYRDSRFFDETSDYYTVLFAYKGALNIGDWSFFAGNQVLLILADHRRKGVHHRDFTTSGYDSLQLQSETPIDTRSQWMYGYVLPLYGVARRFGRWSLHLQGAGLVAVHALVAVTLNPVRDIAPHGEGGGRGR